ncbi:DUF2628 domain-containing protein [Thalassospira sp. MA62]|nr:DUF2628 domain-containing protein [Thalassospira sp. MA62]
MKLYTVHIHPGDAEPMENAVLIREGFNFWAFLLTGLWALYHRLWLAFIGIVVVSVLCSLTVMLFDGGPEMDFALALVTGIGFGLIANDLRRRKLAAKGYKLHDIVAGQDHSDAEHRCFERVKNSGLRKQVSPSVAQTMPSTPSTGSPSYP